jgi:hypothetical protein
LPWGGGLPWGSSQAEEVWCPELPENMGRGGGRRLQAEQAGPRTVSSALRAPLVTTQGYYPLWPTQVREGN